MRSRIMQWIRIDRPEQLSASASSLSMNPRPLETLALNGGDVREGQAPGGIQGSLEEDARRPSLLSRVRNSLCDACDTVGDFCHTTFGWSQESIGAVTGRIKRAISSVLGKDDGSEQRRQEKGGERERRGSWLDFPLGGNSTPPPELPQHTSAYAPTEPQFTTRFSSGTENLVETEIKEAICLLVDALRRNEKEKTEEHQREIVERQEELQKKIEHLKSHDTGPSNPIVSELINAMSSDLAPMSLQEAEFRLEVAERLEAEALKAKALQ